MIRAQILKNINQNKPDLVSLLEIPSFETPSIDLLSLYQKTAASVGIQVIISKEKTPIEETVQSLFSEQSKIIDLTNSSTVLPQNSSDFSDLDILILKGQYGVAENAAIWLDENDFKIRLLPFITQHLVVVLEQKKLVENMHQAYQKIKIDETGFCIFIAGPSKTADIEQALVIGAQAARSMVVIMT